MAAWQIPLTALVDPRDEASRRVEDAQEHQLRQRLGQQSIDTSQQEQLLRDQEIERAKLANTQTRNTVAADHAFYQKMFEDHPSLADGSAPSPAAAPVSVPAPAALPLPPQRFDDMGRPVGSSGTVVLGAPMSAEQSLTAPPREDQYGRRVLSPALSGAVIPPAAPAQAAPQPQPPVAPPPAPQAPQNTLGSVLSAPRPAAAPAIRAPAAATQNPFESALRAAYAAGGGAGINDLWKGEVEKRSKQFTMQKEAAELQIKQGEEIASALQPVKNAASPEQKEAAYQQALPYLHNIANQMHTDLAQHIPAHYDEGFVTAASTFGIKATDQGRMVKEAADTLRMTTDRNLAHSDNLQKRYRDELGLDLNLTAGDLAVKNQKYEAFANAQDPSGALGRAFKTFEVGTWTPDLAKRMREAGMTPNERNMLPVQQLNAKTAQVRANTAAQRATNETAAQHRETILNLARQAIAESVANGGRGIEDARKNVENPAYYQGHPIGANRGAVLKALDDIEGKNLHLTKEQLDINNKEKVQRRLDEAGVGGLIGPTAPAAGRGGTVTPVPAAPAAAPPPATAPPSAGAIQIKRGDGVVRSFPDEPAAQRFEALVRNAGGTTSRVQ